MTITKFSKYSGNGNDFIILEKETISSEYVLKLCHRHLGIGADGILLVSESEHADAKMRIFNADGFEADMCGNGLRCVATYIDQKTIEKKSSYKIQTKNSLYTVYKRNNQMTIEMSEVKEKDLYDLSEFKDFSRSFYINTGVPHLVFLLDDVMSVDIKKVGSFYRYHPLFPKGTNVNFFSLKNNYLRTYERGIEDETFSCGTGIVATALALKEWFGTEGEIRFQTKGGSHLVELSDKILFSGEVKEICKGETSL